MASEEPAGAPRRLSWLVGAALGVATVLVFALGLAGDFVWDDTQLIVSNAYVRDPSLLGSALTHGFWHTSTAWGMRGPVSGSFYRPLVTLSYALEFRLFGERPFGYHVVNLGLHLGCVLLVYNWLRRRLAGTAPEGAVLRAAGIGAALFALHPTRPESVTWISGCTDPWMTLWVLLGLAARDRWKTPAGVALTGVCLAVATLAKETAIVVPFALLADAVLLPATPGDRRRAAGTAGVLCATTLTAFALRFALPAVRVPAHGGDTLSDALPRVVSSLGHYISRTVWDIPPSVMVAPERYDALGRPFYDPWSLALGAMALAAVAALALAATAWRRPRARPWLADAAWFLGPLVPVLNLVPLRLNVLIAPRFLYLPLLGVCAALARWAAPALAGTARTRAITGLAAAVVLTAAGVASLQHVGHLLTEDDLWTYEYQIHPGNLSVIKYLALERSHARRYAECYTLLHRGLAAARAEPSRPHEVMFSILLAATEVKQTSDSDQATLLADRAFLDGLAAAPGTVATLDSPHARLRLALSPGERTWVVDQLTDPYRLARAVAHARTLSFPEAERLLGAILRDEPRSSLAWRNLLLVYAGEQRWDDALGAAARAARLLPDDRVVPLLGRRIERARHELTPLPSGSPERAVALAELFIDLGQRELARRTLAPALAADPGRPDAVLALARADETDGLPQTARAVLVRALHDAPQRAETWQAALRAIDARHPQGAGGP